MESSSAIGSNEEVRQLDTALLLRAYAAGMFPMADSRDATDVFWVEPRRRGILPLDGFHLSRSLARMLRRETLRHSHDAAFDQVIHACAASTPQRPESWINAPIRDAYRRLHQQGHAHSIETWDADGQLVGGLYGVQIGAAFFGESMFSRVTDASKAALAHLIARLRAGGFRLLDTQFLTSHLASLGGIEIRRPLYRQLLADATRQSADWQHLDRLTVQGCGGAAGGAAGGDAAADGVCVAATAVADSAGAARRTRRERVLATVGGPSGKCIVQLLSQTS